MAIGTATERRRALVVAWPLPWMRLGPVLPVADGTIDMYDRSQVGGVYRAESESQGEQITDRSYMRQTVTGCSYLTG